jgi:amino acid permease
MTPSKNEKTNLLNAGSHDLVTAACQTRRTENPSERYKQERSERRHMLERHLEMLAITRNIFAGGGELGSQWESHTGKGGKEK